MTDKISAALEKKAMAAGEKLANAKSSIQTVILGQDKDWTIIAFSLPPILCRQI